MPSQHITRPVLLTAADAWDRFASDDCWRDGAQSVVVLSTRRIRRLHGAALETSLALCGRTVRWLMVPEGERAKSLEHVSYCYAQLVRWGVDRTTPFMTLGGGVITDLGGYVAATFLRGMPWIALPTTLVAQLDSAIGGKVGVNLAAGKNLVGTFYQPMRIFCHKGLLATLPIQAVREGFVEALKCGLLADPVLVTLVTSDEAPSALTEIIQRTIAVKLRYATHDVTDTRGRRAMLNLGHTVGHALERHGGYRQWSHGAAVGAGLVASVRLSHQWGLCTSRTVEAVTAAVLQLRQPTQLPVLLPTQWADLLAGEKKRRAEEIQFIALHRASKPCIYPIACDRLAHDLVAL
jgi:3-dehydroquinate synthase